MDLQKYIDKPNSKVPIEIATKLESVSDITKTLFENKNDILEDKKLHLECGYERLEDYYLVSMYEMLQKKW